ncbi:MAG: transcription antitermination protein NusB [Alphaproteobacteria bacterium]|nr:transcription antitermination protein NusB [Alphaproteobacteria bacterium]
MKMTQTKEKTATKKNIAKNTSARLHAVQAIYQIQSTGHKAKDVIPEYREHRFGMEIDGEKYIYPDDALFTKIVSGVESRKSDLLSILEENLKKDDKSRNVEDLLKCILLCGTLEILDHNDIDAPIIINDYIEVTKAYYGDAESALVNATLDGFRKVVRI